MPKRLTDERLRSIRYINGITYVHGILPDQRKDVADLLAHIDAQHKIICRLEEIREGYERSTYPEADRLAAENADLRAKLAAHEITWPLRYPDPWGPTP